MMVLVEDQGRIVGGALGFGSTRRAIGLEPRARGKGLGRQLMERLEEETNHLGCGAINLGVGPGPSNARDFYAHLGYSGRSRMTKELSMSPILRYGQPDERRRGLEELRQGRALRLAERS